MRTARVRYRVGYHSMRRCHSCLKRDSAWHNSVVPVALSALVMISKHLSRGSLRSALRELVVVWEEKLLVADPVRCNRLLPIA